MCVNVSREWSLIHPVRRGCPRATVAATENHLYDFTVGTDEAALYFEPWRFEPRTERMIELIDCFSQAGYKTVIVDWRGLFPWGEPRFRARLAYPEHAIVEAHRRAAKSGIDLITRFPFGRGMGNFLSHPGYRHLRLEEHDPDALRPDAPGAGKFLCDLFEDMLALIPELPGIYLDPAPGGPEDLGYTAALRDSLLERVIEQAGDLSIVASSSLDGLPVAGERCAFLSTPPDDFVNTGRPAFPPSIELYFDLMPGGEAMAKEAGAGRDPGSTDGKVVKEEAERVRSKRLRRAFDTISEELEECWGQIRRISESSYLPATLGCSPEISFAILCKGVRGLKERIEKLSNSFADIRDLFDPLLAPGVYCAWLQSQVNPVMDQIAHLEEKSRMVKVWTATK